MAIPTLRNQGGSIPAQNIDTMSLSRHWLSYPKSANPPTFLTPTLVMLANRPDKDTRRLRPAPAHQVAAEDLVSDHSVEVLMVRAAERYSGNRDNGFVSLLRPIEDGHHSSLLIVNLNPQSCCHVKEPLRVHGQPRGAAR